MSILRTSVHPDRSGAFSGSHTDSPYFPRSSGPVVVLLDKGGGEARGSGTKTVDILTFSVYAAGRREASRHPAGWSGRAVSALCRASLVNSGAGGQIVA